jgi:hypothetical protein
MKNNKVRWAVVGGAVAVAVAACSSGGGSSADHGKIMPPYVAQLIKDGYAPSQISASTSGTGPCHQYAIGADSGDANGELVALCPNQDALDLELLNLGPSNGGDAEQVPGTLMFTMTGPLSGL